MGLAISLKALATKAMTAKGLFVAGLGLTATSMIMQGRAAKAQTEGQQAMAEYNAKVNEQNAKAAELKSQFDQRRQVEEGQRILGTLRAGLGGSGAVTSEGAPLALVEEQAEELALENALIGYEGMVTAGQFRSQAAISGMEATLAGARARSAMPTAAIGAGATLLTGFGTASALGMFGKTSGVTPSFPTTGINRALP
jgi:hypothetical protein